MGNKTIAGFRLSVQQERLWALQQNSRNEPYRARCAVLLEGPLDCARLQNAVRQVIGRHEILRTVFQLQPGLKNPFQIIRDAGEPAWETLDLRNLSESEQQKTLKRLLRETQWGAVELE